MARAMRNPVREFVEHTWGVQVVAWDLPVDETGSIYEVIVDGELLRADSVHLLIAALAERTNVRRLRVTPALRLVA